MSAPTCAAVATPPAGSTTLSVLQSATRPANWLRDAPGYPQWTISDGVHVANGSGPASLDASTYAQFSGATKITFVNGSGRLVNKICNQLLDNGAAPSGQLVLAQKEWIAFSVQFPPEGVSVKITPSPLPPPAMVVPYSVDVPS